MNSFAYPCNFHEDASAGGSQESFTCGPTTEEVQVWQQMSALAQSLATVGEADMRRLAPMKVACRPLLQGAGADESQLGHGRFGTVCEGLCGKQVVAIKLSEFMPLSELLDSTFAMEYVATVVCAHDNVVKTLGWYLESRTLEDGTSVHCTVLVMERMSCSLRDYALSHKMSLADVAVVMLKALDGLSYVASRGLVHGDVKTDNLLLNFEAAGEAAVRVMEVKLCDFGLSSIVDPSTGKAPRIGGNEWFSPNEEDEPLMAPFAYDLFGLGRTALDLLNEREHKAFNRPFLSNMKLRKPRQALMSIAEKWQHPAVERRPQVEHIQTELESFISQADVLPTACSYQLPGAEPSLSLRASPSEAQLLDATQNRTAGLTTSISAVNLAMPCPTKPVPAGGLSQSFAKAATSRCDSSPALDTLAPAYHEIMTPVVCHLPSIASFDPPSKLASGLPTEYSTNSSPDLLPHPKLSKTVEADLGSAQEQSSPFGSPYSMACCRSPTNGSVNKSFLGAQMAGMSMQDC